MKWMLLVVATITLNALAFDPMAPPGFQKIDKKTHSTLRAKPSQSNYILRQIVIRDDYKSAVINGYVVNEGGYIKGARVMRIGEQEVVINVSGKETTLYLKPNVARVRQ